LDAATAARVEMGVEHVSADIPVMCFDEREMGFPAGQGG
jgi:hypothetical protein